jgi:hypothetical protein
VSFAIFTPNERLAFEELLARASSGELDTSRLEQGPPPKGWNRMRGKDTHGTEYWVAKRDGQYRNGMTGTAIA